VASPSEGINVRVRAFFRSTMLVISWTILLVPAARAQDTPLARGIKHFDKGDYAQAAVAVEQGVAAGDAACMDFLGFLYLEGYGKQARPWIAFGYFREAAELGNDQACRNLGNMYFSGRGVKPDPVQAAAWWEKSVALGKDPRPAFSLGQLYWLGDALPQDAQRARKYWHKAKQLGSNDALVALAVLDVKAGGTVDVGALTALAAKEHLTAHGTLKFFKLEKAGTAPLVKDVPFVHQAHNFCGVASSTMLLRHQGVKVSQFDVARTRTVNKWGEGSYWDELVAVAGKLGRKWRIDSFANTEQGFTTAKAALIRELRAGRPAIIDILESSSSASAHSIVVCGYDPPSAEFLVCNPALPFPGFQVFTEKRLKVIWRSRGFIPKNSKLRRPMMRADSGGDR
jgi:hypothetical protein